MAVNFTIGGDGDLFVGEDKLLKLFVYDRKVVNVVRYSAANLPLGATGVVVVPVDANGVTAVPIDMTTGWVVHFVVRKKDGTTDPALLDKTASLSGTYNADPIVNTQRWEVTLNDETDLILSVFPRAEIVRHSWKRVDAGLDTVLSYGDFNVELATQH